MLENGKAVHCGRFDVPEPEGPPFWAWGDLQQAWRMTALYKLLYFGPKQWGRDKMLELQRAIFVASQDVLRRKWGNVQLHVLIYPDAAQNIAFFHEAGVATVDLAPVFPGWKADSEYSIPYDGHPTSKPHEIIGKAIVTHLLRGTVAE